MVCETERYFYPIGPLAFMVVYIFFIAIKAFMTAIQYTGPFGSLPQEC